MIQKNIFIRHIATGDFKGLFISELGWNRFRGQSALPIITIEERQFCITTIAERNGFQVLTCIVDEVPNNSTCRRLDSKLRRQANDYICIFMVNDTQHHLWLVPVKNNERRDLVFVEYENAQKADLLYSKVDGFSFALDEVTTIVDVRARVHKAFMVNSEKVTKDFYTGFRKQHTAFARFITGMDDDVPAKDNRNKQWYTSVMLNRLMFCYFIQKKGFLNSDVDYLQNKLRWVRRERGENRFYDSFYRGFLRELFSDGLNAPRHTRDWEQTYGKIPYLNGGMFDEHQLEREYPDVDIPDEAFEQLFAFFDTWRWHLDTRITASGKDINPDVLGYIFEQYINDRAAMGAYYTKEDITEYIGKNCILPFLMDRLKETDPKAFKPDGEVWAALRGSGDRYIYDAVKRGYTPDWQSRIPADIAVGIDTQAPNLLERRSHWNTPTPDTWALPTEIWRETIERLQRCDSLLSKIAGGEITDINDFITLNLDIRSFVYDLLHDTTDNHLVLHFYHAMQRVTILDPTCGSGAFLFAAMNILEPLYEVCIERMQEFNATNPLLFKDELAEIDNRYRSNIQYFIFKSIILRNLYGVDIMVEATEIAKLRLFLKMVAVVEVDRRADNMGLDPLPDIDFNIRCGNTLVGYATEQQLNRDLTTDIDVSQVEANKKFKAQIDEEMANVATVYDEFKQLQMTQETDMSSFKAAKQDLNNRLLALNDLLNQRLFMATGSGEYSAWLGSHKPFHWLAEFYQIMHANGGFDIIIGNPPYVVYTKKDKVTKRSISDSYKIKDYKTLACNNLYAFCVERSLSLLSSSKRIGMIVPLSFSAAKNMLALRQLLSNSKCLYVSSYEIRPGKLFDGNAGAEQRLNIIISYTSSHAKVLSTGVMRWPSEHRNILFPSIYYSSTLFIDRILRFSSELENQIYAKYSTNRMIKALVSVNHLDSKVHYRSAGLRYWIIFLRKGFNTDSLSNNFQCFINSSIADYVMSALNSNLFWWYYSINFDMFNLTLSNILDFRLDYDKACSIGKLSSILEEDMNEKKLISNVVKKDGSTNQSFAYQKKLSKPIIDEIDKVLAKHYGFTEEELDFIINYDIKYRMGDELNND